MIYENNYIIQVFYILHNCVVDIFHIFSVTFLALNMPLNRYNFFFIIFYIILEIISGVVCIGYTYTVLTHNLPTNEDVNNYWVTVCNILNL